MTRPTLLTTAALALACLAACSGGGGGDDAVTQTAAADTAHVPTTSEIIQAQNQVHLDGKAGRWARLRPGTDTDQLTDEQRRQIKRLESLGYVAGSRLAPTMQNVTVHDPDRSWEGLNLFTSGHAPEALLMDMDGQVLHRWACHYWTVWPDSATERDHPGTQHWRRARILPGGDLLAIYEGLGIARLDRRSNVVWANHCGAHHDLEVLPDGDILVLAREARVIRRVHPRQPVLEDFVLRLGPDGAIEQRVSLLEAFERSDAYRYIWEQCRVRHGDIFHTNSVEMLDGRIADRAPEFTAGRVLVSIRNLDAIAVIDLDRVEVVWAFQDRFEAQHDATILTGGHLMLFNNLHQPGMSSVHIYDPADGARIWRWRGTETRPFFSRTCGTSQQLPNGNVLITESDNGRAFEIDAAEETVWEFYNPHRAGDHDEYIATLFEVLRLPADFPLDWTIAPK